ncbi:response regulator [Gloeothece verrucosa]|uniref:Protein PatA n=1 Tax=Gloeothece verrucosa (strain PCC 7822) TaxID=497965 RepID=E0UCZ3_GLOV7|nr:response regulator [Gloeothece verrucosa]ADN16458.1 response regulator receiver protein [Gloeothece verrucosa PCC 7822]
MFLICPTFVAQVFFSVQVVVKDDLVMAQNLPDTDATDPNFTPIQMLERLADTQESGCLHLRSQDVDWLFYFRLGKLVYATHSIDPVDRLERHLRRLSHEITSLTREVCHYVRVHIENNLSTDITQFSDYQGIYWLLEEKILSEDAIVTLVKKLTAEVLENYLVVSSIEEQEVLSPPLNLPIFCAINLADCIESCRQRIEGWQALGPEIVSPYQRPYFFNNAYAQNKLSEDQQQKLSKILKGYSFYHLASIFDQDELKLAQKLYTLVKNKAILLREPQPPYNKLPKFYKPEPGKNSRELEEGEETTLNLSVITKNSLPTKICKIACIDDSQTMLQELSRFLDAENFIVHTINDSLKALMQVIRIKPDLILLDVTMPNVDGYQICSLLRKNAEFKKTPIIMVTAKSGLIDRARAKIVGATDYITKPFSQEELLRMVFRYLT